LFNCLGLYFFGRSVEDAIGKRSFLKLYFLSGTAGGLVQLLALLLPGHADRPVVGASAGVLGLLAAYATLFPDREVVTWIWFLPIRVKAKYLLWFFGLLSLYGTFVPFDAVAHAAHLGGMLAGWVYLRWGMQAESMLWARHARRPKLRPRELMRVPGPKSSSWQRPKASSADE